MPSIISIKNIIYKNYSSSCCRLIMRVLVVALLVLINLFTYFLLPITTLGWAETRIKDIVNFEGFRDNMIIGYGLVVGLNNSGDNLNNSRFTEVSLLEHLKKMGVNTSALGQNKTRNVAAVMITANLPAFVRPGARIPVRVSATGDAKSLRGGQLIATPLLGADGQVYAIAQGSVELGQEGGGGGNSGAETGGGNSPIGSNSATRTSIAPNKAIIPTSGYIDAGAIVEKSVDFAFNDMHKINLSLKKADFSTARSIMSAINTHMRLAIASTLDAATVELKVPEAYKNNLVNLLAELENLTIIPDNAAQIVIDLRSGTVVIGDNVRINRVAIAQNGMLIKVQDARIGGAAAAVSSFGGQDAAGNNEEKMGDDEAAASNSGGVDSAPAVGFGKNAKFDNMASIAILQESATLSDLVRGLNALGVRSNELISILRAMERAGALQGSIEFI